MFLNYIRKIGASRYSGLYPFYSHPNVSVNLRHLLTLHHRVLVIPKHTIFLATILHCCLQ